MSYPACYENERRRQCGYFPFPTFAYFKYGSNLTGADVPLVFYVVPTEFNDSFFEIQFLKTVFLPNVRSSGVATISEE